VGTVLRAQRVSYQYGPSPLSRHAQPVSLELAQGESLLLSGPSGSGKSTLARCFTGQIPHLYRGTLTGEVRINGLDTSTTPLWQLMEQAGLVFQNPAGQMLAGTVEDEVIFGLENLGLPARLVNERLEEALARFGLVQMRKRAPRTLSGGEQQSLALASIIARRPALLVLDEPLSMLDPTAAAGLVNYLAELAASGTAVLICEHRHEYLAGIPRLRQLDLPGVQPTEGEAPGEAPSGLPALPTWHSGGELKLYAHDVGVVLGHHAVLENLDVVLSGGEVTAIVGRNGVGKTTLLRALAGLQRCEGHVTIQCRSGRSCPPRLGLAFQNADLQLFNATVRDEILHKVPNPDMGLYSWLLQALALEAYESTPPLLLSEGEKKRVALATTLMHQPDDGLLLDEPALGQDAAHKRILMRLMRGVAASGRLAVFTTHDLELASHADRLILLGADGILADGRPSDVFDATAAWRSAGMVIPEWFRAEVAAR
jgi:energy-coupling factor transport system ATP-binding protein